MKKPLIVALQKENPGRLESFLRACGYNGQVFSQPEDFHTALMDSEPDLVLVDSAGAADTLKCASPVLELQSLDDHLRHDFSRLYEHLQAHFPDSPRKHLRVEIELPSLLYKKKECLIGKILSLGTGGVFISSACLTMQPGDRVQVVFPLWGMQMELEIRGEVAHRCPPGRFNNYRQGFGVRFSSSESQITAMIREYIQDYLKGHFATSSWGKTLPPRHVPPSSHPLQSLTLERK